DIEFSEMLKVLGGMGITSLLVEGGKQIFTEFIRSRLFDKITWMMAPIIIGKGVPAVGNLGIEKISDALRFQKVTFSNLEDQIIIQGYSNLEFLGRLKEMLACSQE
ncbi:MAG: hypothetical protein D6748_11470, partial [Calditrichaeota bacterium]